MERKNPNLDSVELSQSELREGFEGAAKKVHIIGAWVAIIADPVFAFTDYLNIPDDFISLLIIRLSVSAITLFTLYLYRKYNFRSFWVVLVPFLLISFQNSYTFMLIEEESVLGHCLNYIALFLGAGMFILWPLIYSVIVVILSLVATYIFFQLNGGIGTEYFWIHGGLLQLNIEIFMIVLIQFRYNLTKREIKARLSLEKSKNLLVSQKAIIETKNELLLDSLQYAKRIQEAILGDQQRISSWFSSAFILFKPKDIVSGDFYWLYADEEQDIKVLIAGDCTGHGVPAALMTVLGNSILTDLVEHKRIYQPDKLLSELDSAITKALKKNSNVDEVNDGMDVSVITIENGILYFSAAKNPLIKIRDGEIEQIKGSKFTIGGSAYDLDQKAFTKHGMDIKPGDRFYIYSDGFQDQFGGPKEKKFMTKRFRNLLLKSGEKGLQNQKQILDEEFISWMGDNEQTDDVLIIGIEID